MCGGFPLCPIFVGRGEDPSALTPRCARVENPGTPTETRRADSDDGKPERRDTQPDGDTTQATEGTGRAAKRGTPPDLSATTLPVAVLAGVADGAAVVAHQGADQFGF